MTLCVPVSDRRVRRRVRGGAEADGGEGWRRNHLQTLLDPDPKCGYVPIRPAQPRQSVQMHLPSTVSTALQLGQDGGRMFTSSSRQNILILLLFLSSFKPSFFPFLKNTNRALF